jgi:hypothetical protein
VMEKGNEAGVRPGTTHHNSRGGGPRARGRRWGAVVRQHQVPAKVSGVRRVAAVQHGMKTRARGPVREEGKWVGPRAH